MIMHLKAGKIIHKIKFLLIKLDNMKFNLLMQFF